jgi:hypothetical protein
MWFVKRTPHNITSHHIYIAGHQAFHHINVNKKLNQQTRLIELLKPSSETYGDDRQYKKKLKCYVDVPRHIIQTN